MPTTPPSRSTGRAHLVGCRRRPGLLVSVRNDVEAAAALSGGADVIDVKEPRGGALGRPSEEAVASVVSRIAGARPVTMALGELRDVRRPLSLPEGIAVAKVGLAGASAFDWRGRLDALRDGADGLPIVPVGYAEESIVGAPRLEAVVEVGAEAGWMVIDTQRKTGVSSLECLGQDRVAEVIQQAIRAGVQVVLAGGLSIDRLAAAVLLGPALVGVRGAACDGGRDGVVSRGRVQSIALSLADCRSDKPRHPPNPTRNDRCRSST